VEEEAMLRVSSELLSFALIITTASLFHAQSALQHILGLKFDV
jgi:hypothetical protein